MSPPSLNCNKMHKHMPQQTNKTNKNLRCGNRKGLLGRNDQTHHRMGPKTMESIPPSKRNTQADIQLRTRQTNHQQETDGCIQIKHNPEHQPSRMSSKSTAYVPPKTASTPTKANTQTCSYLDFNQFLIRRITRNICLRLRIKPGALHVLITSTSITCRMIAHRTQLLNDYSPTLQKQQQQVLPLAKPDALANMGCSKMNAIFAPAGCKANSLHTIPTKAATPQPTPCLHPGYVTRGPNRPIQLSFTPVRSMEATCCCRIQNWHVKNTKT